jgi:flagellar basal body P-ring protein FlgI
VAGLAGVGDSNSIAMLHGVVNLLQRYGISETSRISPRRTPPRSW